MENHKKGQFFIVTLVIVSFSFFLIFSYIQTTSSNEVRAFQRPADRDLLNVMNVIEEQNEKNAIDWYDTNWKYRKRYVVGSLTCVGVKWNPHRFSFNSNGHDEQGDCTKELVATNSSKPFSKIRLNVSGTSCTTVSVNCSDAISSTFYIYYGHPTTNEGNLIENVGTSESATVTEQLAWVNCTQIENDYQLLGYSMNCSAIGKLSQTVTYNISFYSQNLKFSGNFS